MPHGSTSLRRGCRIRGLPSPPVRAGAGRARGRDGRDRQMYRHARFRGFPIKVQPGFAESHAAVVKHTAIRAEKTMGVVNACLQLTPATATKQMANAHAMDRTRAKVSAGSAPSSHANTAANKRNTEKKSPNALKKSQYVRVNPCASKWTERINPRTASAPHSGLF